MTGKGLSALAGAKTFRVRQSSEVAGGTAPTEAISCGVSLVRCRQAGPNLVASLAPVHGRTGFAGVQRASPTGGSAKGTPLKLMIPPASVTPFRTPSAMRIEVAPTGASAACAEVIERLAATANRPIRMELLRIEPLPRDF